jgi:hypothetical protein
MPALVYPTGNFQPFTKILSSEVNGKFNAITTLLNTTKLDSTNVQQYGLTADRIAAQTSMSVVITDASGYLTTSTALSSDRGGSGFSYTPVLADAQKVLQVNVLGTALTFDATPAPATVKIYNFYRFG